MRKEANWESDIVKYSQLGSRSLFATASPHPTGNHRPVPNTSQEEIDRTKGKVSTCAIKSKWCRGGAGP